MPDIQSRFFRILTVLLVLIGLELSARFWITHFANTEQFYRFATIEQYTARYGDPGFSPHRFTGYFGTQNWGNASDRHNTLGYRGDEISRQKPEGVFRIVCLGSSATYGTGVKDYHMAFPYQLQKELNETGYSNIEVINAGISGYTTWESLLELQFLVLDLKPDLIILYPGIDDISARLVWPPTAYRGDNTGFVTAPFIPKPSIFERSNALRILMVSLGWSQPLASPAQLWSPRAATAYDLLFTDQWQAGNYPQGSFREVSAEEMLSANPPEYFERNIRNIVSTSRANGIAMVLVTTASSPEFFNPQTASVEYQTALAEQNGILQKLADEKHILLLDLAQVFSPTIELFTDGIVFSAEGNLEMTHLLVDFLLANNLIIQ